MGKFLSKHQSPWRRSVTLSPEHNDLQSHKHDAGKDHVQIDNQLRDALGCQGSPHKLIRHIAKPSQLTAKATAPHLAFRLDAHGQIINHEVSHT